jgi:hypothetical protein
MRNEMGRAISSLKAEVLAKGNEYQTDIDAKLEAAMLATQTQIEAAADAQSRGLDARLAAHAAEMAASVTAVTAGIATSTASLATGITTNTAAISQLSDSVDARLSNAKVEIDALSARTQAVNDILVDVRTRLGALEADTHNRLGILESHEVTRTNQSTEYERQLTQIRDAIINLAESLGWEAAYDQNDLNVEQPEESDVVTKSEIIKLKDCIISELQTVQAVEYTRQLSQIRTAIMELAASLGWDVENDEQDDQPEFYVISPELSEPFTLKTFTELRDEIFSDLRTILHPVNDPPDGKRTRIQADTDQIARQIVHDDAFVAHLAAMVGDLLSTRAAPASTAPPPAATHAPDSIEDRLEHLERLVQDAGLGDFRPDYRDSGMLDDAIITPTPPPPPPPP